VAGYLFVPKLTLPPFKQVCKTCRSAEISRQDDGLFYCNRCKVANACVLIKNLKGCICSLNRPIDVIMKSEWIEAVVSMNKETLLKLLHENCIQLI